MTLSPLCYSQIALSMRLILGLMIQIFFFNNVNASDDEKRLIVDIFRRYNKNVRPVHNSNETVNVEVRHTLSQILDVIERKELFTSSGWSSLRWNDAYLSWDPRRYNGIKRINFRPNLIWIPDIIIYDDFESRKSFGSQVDQVQNLVTLNYAGNITWGLKTTFITKCHLEIYYFPFDTQSCPFRYGSWSHEQERITISPDSQIKSDPHVSPNGWLILGYSAKVRKFNYSTNIYGYAEFTITFQRLACLAAVNLILPPVIIGTLVLHAFVLPAAAGERLALAITLLLAMIFFIINVGYLIPNDNLTLPLIYRFFLATVSQIVVQIISLIFGMQLYHKKLHDPPMPRWVKKLVFEQLAYWIGVRSPVEKKKDTTSILSVKEMESLIEISITFPEHKRTNDKMLNISHEDESKTIREWSIVAVTIDRCFYFVFLLAWVLTLFTFFILVTIH